MPQHTPLYMIASPNPRVGKTLLGRLLIEYLLGNDRKAVGYDLNPRNPSLATHFPDLVWVSDITETRGQMALFDRLIADDPCTTVIDLGYSLFEQFFSVMTEIGFEREARRRSIEPIVLFVADSARTTVQSYAELRGCLPLTAFVPVHNEGASFMFSRKDFPPSRAEYGVVRIPRLSPIVRGAIDRPSFSFLKHLSQQSGGPTEVQHWIDNVFTEFRELELRQLMGKLAPSFGRASAAETSREARKSR